MIKIVRGLAALFLVLLFLSPVKAQQSAPLKFDLKNQGAGIVTTPDQQNLVPSLSVSVMCVFNMTSHTGQAHIAYTIQGKVPSQNVYFDLVQSQDIAKDNTPGVLILGAGIEGATGLYKALPVSRTWRASIEVTGTAPVVNGALTCRVG